MPLGQNVGQIGKMRIQIPPLAQLRQERGQLSHLMFVRSMGAGDMSWTRGIRDRLEARDENEAHRRLM